MRDPKTPPSVKVQSKPRKPYTDWDPTYFKVELDRVVEQVRQVRVRHVIMTTVPHVTIAPVARGVAHMAMVRLNEFSQSE
ncbi:MAG: hypothetical protein ACP5RH_04750 [Leptodesmis sp.]|uniref:hypothetical protein n=1 Tax=Leptodesmis sp. TaxID=3100501 RepID=UPI003D09A911